MIIDPENGMMAAVLTKDIELNGAKAKAGATGCVYREHDGTLVFSTLHYTYEGDKNEQEEAEFIVNDSDVSIC